MKYLISRPGKLCLPDISTYDKLKPEKLNPYSSPYDRTYDSGGQGGFASEANYAFYQPVPPQMLSGEVPETDTYVWNVNNWNYFVSNQLAPHLVIDDLYLEPDEEPINGHISWGNGLVRYGVSDIGKDAAGIAHPAHLGYIYHKYKGNNPRWNDRVFAYYDNGRWKGDGWYEFDTGYLKANSTNPIYGTPRGTVLNNSETSSTISARIEWSNLYFGNDMGDLTKVEYTSEAQASAVHIGYGLPYWQGTLSVMNPSYPDITLVGVPIYDAEKGGFSLEFVWDNYYSPNNYYRYYECTYRYEDTDVRSIFPRGFDYPGWDQGWWEFTPPTKIHKGDNLELRNYLPQGSEATPANATLSCSGFIEPSSAEITCWADPIRTKKKSFSSNVLIGTFNVGTMIY